MAIATAIDQVVAAKFIIAMCGPLSEGLLRRLIGNHGHAASSEVAHTCPPSDLCIGSDAAHAWAAIGFIAADGPACQRHRYRSALIPT